MVYALLRVLGGAFLLLFMAATVGIPARKRGPEATSTGVYLGTGAAFKTDTPLGISTDCSTLQMDPPGL